MSLPTLIAKLVALASQTAEVLPGVKLTLEEHKQKAALEHVFKRTICGEPITRGRAQHWRGVAAYLGLQFESEKGAVVDGSAVAGVQVHTTIHLTAATSDSIKGAVAREALRQELGWRGPYKLSDFEYH
jgi:hypothetical protein